MLSSSSQLGPGQVSSLKKGAVVTEEEEAAPASQSLGWKLGKLGKRGKAMSYPEGMPLRHGIFAFLAALVRISFKILYCF